jgi:energy-converting hydrogenase Eha subunit E
MQVFIHYLRILAFFTFIKETAINSFFLIAKYIQVSIITTKIVSNNSAINIKE